MDIPGDGLLKLLVLQCELEGGNNEDGISWSKLSQDPVDQVMSSPV